MAIIYASSMDQYGPAVGTDDAPASPSGVLVTWQWDNDVLIGDGWGSEPSYTNNNFRFRIYGTYELGTPSFGARRGERALIANGVNVMLDDTSFQTQPFPSTMCHPLTIPGATAVNRRIHIAFGMDSLPEGPGDGWILWGLTGANQRRFGLRVNPSGRLEVYDGLNMILNSNADPTTGFSQLPTLLSVSQSPVIEANTWYSINIEVTTNAVDATADIDVYVGEIIPANKVIEATGVAFTDQTGGAFGAGNNIDIWGILPVDATYVASTGRSEIERALRDIVLYDSTGSYNTDLIGQVFVSVQETRYEDAGGGWTAHPRENLGDGILDHKTAPTGVRVADAADFELGAGEFTIEGWWRFDSIPETGEKVLFGKWDDANNAKSYKLVFDTTLDTLRWVISTDGAAETILWEYPVEDLIDFRKWYNVAVTREVISGVGTLRVFINGVQYGVNVIDNNTYHDGAAHVGIASLWELISGVQTLVTASAFVGYVDEFRFTKGVARYNTSYSVATAPFGRTASADTDFLSVSLLLGWDGALTDESSNAYTVSYGSGVNFIEPNDGDFSFSVLNQAPPVDDAYVEAKQGRATAVLTLTANPTAGETVTLGSVTYTFQTTFSSNPANEINIGANTEETLSNLIAAVQAGAGAGTDYGTGTSANVDVIGQAVFDPQGFFQAQVLGASGNSLASTETLANGSFDNGATFTGGSDIPSPSDFSIERLPAEVTGVLAVQFTGRAYKSDAGSAQVRFDLVGPSAAVGAGSGLDTDLSPTWVRQIHEEDPDTSATITPSTIVGGRVRLTRTT
jgi:hypothetical protein